MTIQFLLNGKKVRVTSSVPPSLMLVEYIRNYASLTGTKIGCGEGGCGSCIVHISFKQGDEIVNKSINSCLTPLHAVDGTSVTTIEGIGGEKSGKFHPIQERLSEKHGTQCGFCSPGMSMAIYSYLHDNKNRSLAEAENALDGNLCRCTGYRPILDTLTSFCQPDLDIEELGKAECPVQQRKSFHTVHGESHWHRVTSLAEFSEVMKSGKGLKIIAGATSRGIYKDEFKEKSLVDISAIQELHKIEHTEKGVRIGGAISLNKLIFVLKKASQEYHTQHNYFKNIIQHISLIGGTSVRNSATVGGNIALKVHRPDFPSDLVTILTAAGASVEIVTGDVRIQVPINHVKLDKLSIITSIYIPFPRPNEHFLSYKIAMRHQNAHAYVNHSFRFVLSDSKNSIAESSIVFGALSHKVIQSHAVEEFLKGKEFTAELMEGAVKLINQEVQPEKSPHSDYQKTLATNLFYKSLLHIFSLGNAKLDPKLLSAAHPYERPLSSGQKTYGEIDELEKPLGLPVPKLEAKIQASGEATYSGDTAAKNRNTLFGAYVVSTVAAGKIKSIDISEAEEIEGFVSWVTYKDVPGSNIMLSILPGVKDFVFPEEEIVHQGQMVGVIVAETQHAAHVAAQKVKIDYDTSGYKPLADFLEAIKEGSFLAPITVTPNKIERGDVEKTFKDSSLHVMEGDFKFGSQYAFYMEPQVAYAEQSDTNVMVVHASVQDPTNIQDNIAHTLGRQTSKVQVIAKRVGGAFGSKCTQATRTAVAAAVCATKLGNPVTIALDRHTDMINIGKRHPFLCKYKVSVHPETGKIVGLRIELYLDCGYTYDMSPFVLSVCLFDLDNCYFLENVAFNGHLVKTNTPNNTAVRTFGGIQAIYFIESIIHEISLKFKIPLTKVQEVNFYKHGQTTPAGSPILEPDFTLPIIWPDALKNSQFFEKEKQIEEFNKANRWRKRGISVLPLRYYLGFGMARQGTSMHVFGDGSVVVGTSGIDMGQGLNTKVAQTVSHYLDVPMDSITVNFTDTFSNPNSSMSAGSYTSLSCIAAARAACGVMNERIAPFKKAKPNASWKEVCAFAVENGAHLSVTGYFFAGKIIENSRPQTPQKNTEDPMNPTDMDNNSSGVGVSEVEVDILTGEVQVLSAYVYYDTGKSANPAVDIGQVEGGFVMGLGNMLTEEITYSSDGIQLNDSTWTYKIPSSLDIPIHSSMNLFSSLPNKKGLLRSKAASEGPMCLSISVFFAVKNAIRAARAESGISEPSFVFNPPATPHHICAVTGTALEHLKVN